MSGGRPTDYLPEHCQTLIEHMAKGYSYESFAGVVGTCKQTLYNWEKAHAEFLDAKKEAIEKCRLFWERIGIDHVVNISEESKTDEGDTFKSTKSLNASVWIFNMKNRFPQEWREKQPGEDAPAAVVNNITLSDDQLLKIVNAAKAPAKGEG